MIEENNKKKSGWRQATTMFFVLLLVGLFLFSEKAWALPNDYNKSATSTLTASEWNNLANDFVKTWTNTSMTGQLGIGRTASYPLDVDTDVFVRRYLGVGSFNGNTPGISGWALSAQQADQVMALSALLNTSNSTGRVLSINASGEPFARAVFYSSGVYGLGGGSGSRDSFIGRSGVNTFKIGSNYDLSGSANLLVTGKLGIGSTSPNDIFSIGDSSGSFAPGGSDRTGHNYTNTYLSTDNYALTNYGVVKTLISDATNPINQTIASSTFWSGSLTGNIWSNNTGNVGIGTTNPHTKLEVNNTGAGITEGISLSNYTTPAANIGSELSFYGGTGQRISSVFGAWSDASSTDGYLAFRTRGSNSLIERMRITKDGYVGIGTTNPIKNLDLSSTAASTAVRVGYSGTLNAVNLIWNNSSGIAYIQTTGTSDWPLVLGAGANSHLTINPVGNIGIGTTNPGGRLDITTTATSGLRLSTAETTGFGGIRAISNSGNLIYSLSRNDEVSNASLAITSFNGIGFKTGVATTSINSFDMFIASGRVGIGGNSVPNDIFSIANSGVHSPATSTNTGHNYTSTYFSSDKYALANYGLVESLIDAKVPTIISSSSLWGGTTSGNVWSLNSGNVGIGTTTPIQRLHVQGGIGSNGSDTATLLTSYNTSAAGYPQQLNIKHNYSAVEIRNERGNIGFTAGNIGIGTTSPVTNLHISGVNNQSIKIESTNSSGDNDIRFTRTGLETWTLGRDNTANDFKLSYVANNTGGLGTGDLLTIKSNGDVGIGTTNPGAQLDILGKIKLVNDGTIYWGSAANSGRLSWDTGKTIIYGQSGNSLSLGANGVWDMLTISTNGRVGIGGNSVPNDVFSISNGGIHSPATSTNTGHNYTSTYFSSDKYALANYGLVETMVTNSSYWSRNGSDLYPTTLTDNVGIGTNDPTVKLHVLGDSYFDGNATSTGYIAITGASTGAGNLRFSATNPYIFAPSYITIPNGLYVSGGTLYSGAPIKARSGIANDTGPYLTISGGTSTATYFPGTIGIGTNNPWSKFSVVTSVDGDGIQIRRDSTSGGAYSSLGFRTNTTEGGNYGEIRSTRTNIDGGGNSDLSFFTYNNALLERMRILHNGNVGIGTNSPTTQLEIKNATATYPSITFNTSQYGGEISTKKNGGTYGILYVRPEGGETRFARLSGSSVSPFISGYNASDANTFLINTNGYSFFNGGNVGIGAASAPNDIFSIANSGIHSPATSTNTGHNYTSTYFSSDKYALANYGLVESLIDAKVPTIISSSSLWGGTISGNVWSLNSGNVGIGTTAPDTTLTVNNNSYRQQVIKNTVGSQRLWFGSVADSVGTYIGGNAYYNTSFAFIPNYTAASGINFRQDGSTEFWNDSGLTSGVSYTPSKRMIILNNGNVGIGTSNPVKALQVLNTGTQLRLGYDATHYYDVYLDSSGAVNHSPTSGINYFVASGLNSILYVYDYTDGTSSYAINSGKGYSLKKQGTTTVSIPNNGSAYFNQGNIGIGTTAPNDILSLASGGSSAPAGSSNTGHNFTNGYLSTDDYALANYGIVKTLIDSYALWDGTAGSEISSRNIATNVAIGTTSPGSYKLNVNGNTNISGNLNVTGTISGNSTITGTINASNVSAGTFALNTGGGNFSFTGGLGIGIINPGTKLDIVNNTSYGDASSTYSTTLTNSTIKIGNINTGSALLSGISLDANSAWIQAQHTNNSVRNLLLNPIGGNVGIGTNSPEVKLDVIGGNFRVGSAGAGQSLIINGNSVTTATIFLNSTSKSYGIYQFGTQNNYLQGNLGINTTDPTEAKLVINAGTGVALKAYGHGVFTGTLQTQTGSDFAEEFATTKDLEPGTVVVMDDNGYKSVKPSTKSYDKTVVGIVSNNPSIIAGYIDSQHKAVIAMMGVVKVKVTNINGSISKGDLLATSNITGHAMKTDGSKPGTIIGKALENLNGSKGEINVLVNLQ